MRVRARTLGLRFGEMQPGPQNAITDVPGVRVGHSTLIAGGGDEPIARTGVTAILPCDGDVWEHRLPAGAFILNGAGEVSGIIQMIEWGLIESPILLTGTMSVGDVSSAVVRYMARCYPRLAAEDDVVIPVVGECDDSWLNDARAGHVGEEHVIQAIESASRGPVEEGSVGGGTGMITCEFKAGIGTASRLLPAEIGGGTLGVLVMSNFGRRRDFRMDGTPVGLLLDPLYPANQIRPHSNGSIIVIVATDVPLMPMQLGRVCRRAALGIGRTGSYAAHGSGEIIVGFSTENAVPRRAPRVIATAGFLPDRAIDPVYRAAVDATEEAIANSLCMAESMDGLLGRSVPAIPLDKTAMILDLYRQTEQHLTEKVLY